MEPTLAVNKNELDAAVGFYLGYDRGPSYGYQEWTNRQQDAIDDAVIKGQREVYFHALPPGERATYQWSFMRPVVNLTLASGEQYLPLPTDFAGIDGPVTLPGTDRWKTPLIVSGEVRTKRFVFPDTTGAPQYCEVEPFRSPSGETGQRFRLVFWPTADQEYTVSFAYQIAPDALTAATPFPYGGPSHAATFMAACVAAAEIIVDGVKGPKDADYMRLLASSVSTDRRMKPRHFGYNGDTSDGYYYPRHPLHGWSENVVTVGGITPE